MRLTAGGDHENVHESVEVNKPGFGLPVGESQVRNTTGYDLTPLDSSHYDRIVKHEAV